MSRLTSGGLINRGRPFNFTFDGRAYGGFEGDTLASALVANDIKLVGRSFKYHRPRGILTAGSEEPNALVTVGTGAHAIPNTRATTQQLYDGLTSISQNRWPSLQFDVMAVNQLASSIFVAGFYYKTFMWPAAFWEKIYEPLIRRAAGLGKLSTQSDPDTYDRAHAFCDVLVIGAGPAGLSAALAAGRAGARVILAEEDWRLGGRLLSERHEINGADANLWADQAALELASLANVTILTRTAVFGTYDGEYAAVERLTDHLLASAPGQPRQRFWKIVAKCAILATGSVERPLVFGGNDRPGVMTASAVSTYVNRFAATPGKNVAVFTSTDSGWRTVGDLLSAGVRVSAVVDARSNPPADLANLAKRAGAQVMTESFVTDVRCSTVQSLDVCDAAGRRHRIAADALAMAGGWNPSMGLGCHTGARPVWSEAIQGFVLEKPPASMTIVGAASGRFSLGEALRSGCDAGVSVTQALGFNGASSAIPQASDDPTVVKPLWHIPDVRTKAFVDFQHDVTDKDIELAAHEGFISVEHLKRYTTLGMATDQGKIGQVNAHAILARHTGKSIAEAGTVLSRPPFVPVSIGVLAGHHREEHFRPVRRTASHEWAAEQGATFVDAAAWKRAQWFARPGETDWLTTVSREVSATRSGVGVCDVSTLGKIEVLGKDAGTFLDRLYINTMSTLAVGKVRYGVMLREDGLVMDDGTISRLAEDRYFVTTTTVNAGKVMQHIDYCRQVIWPDLDVQAVSVTEQWAQFAVAGPNARALLQNLLPDFDLSNEAFGFMASTAGLTWRNVPTRLYRVSFSGELAYEIGVPATYGDALVRALMHAGASLGVVPYGTEALGVMRIEKGHAAGNELNGRTTAGDLGFGRMMSTKKDFIGRVMAGRPGLIDAARPALIGIKPVDGKARLRAGTHLLPCDAPPVAANDEGYVTSVAYSPGCGHWIGLGLLKHGRERIGQRVRAYDPVRNGDVEVEVCNPIFVDAEGVRLRG